MLIDQAAVQVITVGHIMIVWAPSLPHLTSGILIGVLVNVDKIVKRRAQVHRLVEDWYLVLGYYCMNLVMHAVVHMCHML
jgi:hypothetical protein